MMLFRLGVSMCAAMLMFPLSAAAAENQGPKIGAAMAQAVGAADQGGKFRDFKSLARRRGLIILFARSFDW